MRSFRNLMTTGRVASSRLIGAAGVAAIATLTACEDAVAPTSPTVPRRVRRPPSALDPISIASSAACPTTSSAAYYQVWVMTLDSATGQATLASQVTPPQLTENAMNSA